MSHCQERQKITVKETKVMILAPRCDESALCTVHVKKDPSHSFERQKSTVSGIQMSIVPLRIDHIPKAKKGMWTAEHLAADRVHEIPRMDGLQRKLLHESALWLCKALSKASREQKTCT